MSSPQGSGFITGSLPVHGAPKVDRKHIIAELQLDAKRYGENAAPTLISKSNLAASIASENPELAEKLHREVLAGKLKLHGATSVAVAISQNAVGAALSAQGKYEEAMGFLEQALAVRERVKGEELDAAITRDELAVCLQALGQPEEARAMRLMAGPAAIVCANEPCSRTARAAGVKSLLCCTRCSAVWYCGAACQRADWKAKHKKVCKAKEERGARGQDAAAPSS